MKREVTFTACGFFTLDYTLVHSVKLFPSTLYSLNEVSKNKRLAEITDDSGCDDLFGHLDSVRAAPNGGWLTTSDDQLHRFVGQAKSVMC